LAGNNTDKDGNGVALAFEVFTEYGSFIRAVVRSQVQNEAQADDIFQDFFLSLISKPVPKGVKNIKSYLYRAIINDVVDAVRRAEKYQSRIKKYSEQLNYSINKTDPRNALLDEEEELDNMFALIKGRLPSSESQAIALRYRSHHSIKEVAEKMGVNHRSVSRYISVGLQKVRQFLTLK